jgi:hypothetical protein
MTSSHLYSSARRPTGFEPGSPGVLSFARAAAAHASDVIVHLVGVAVVGLGAWSELARRDQRGMDVEVHEFAVLGDGRRPDARDTLAMPQHLWQGTRRG